MLLNLCILPGDGIGPEVTEQAVLVLQTVADAFGHHLQLQHKNIGGAALTAANDPLPADTLQACLASSAVLLGAVGSPAFDHNPGHLRPEAGLLRLRRELGAYANLRPAICFPALEDSSPLRAELIRGTDIMIVRELLGGLYFGEPRSITGAAGARVATNTMTYDEPAIERIARVAFDLAAKRRQKILSVDKANVLECSRLWREVVTRCAKDHPGIHLSHMYVDSAAMSLALLLRHSFRLEPEAGCIETAVSKVLNEGFRTADLARAAEIPTSTTLMGQKVIEVLKNVAASATTRTPA
jgi:3-isopropylmalate dehydrogenase